MAAGNKSKGVELTAVVLEVGDGREVRLTVEQAKALYEQLASLFGSKVQYVPTQPIYIDRWRWPEPYRPYITRITSSGTYSASLDAGSGLKVRYEGSTTG